MNENVTALLEQYRDTLDKMMIPAKEVEDHVGFPGVRGLKDEAEQIGHAQFMIYTMLADGEEWPKSKIDRHLGIIQGILWTTKIKGMVELLEENQGLDE